MCLSGSKREEKIRPTGPAPLYSFFFTELSNSLFAIDQSFFSCREVLIKTHEAISDELKYLTRTSYILLVLLIPASEFH